MDSTETLRPRKVLFEGWRRGDESTWQPLSYIFFYWSIFVPLEFTFLLFQTRIFDLTVSQKPEPPPNSSHSHLNIKWHGSETQNAYSLSPAEAGCTVASLRPGGRSETWSEQSWWAGAVAVEKQAAEFREMEASGDSNEESELMFPLR